MKRNGKKLLGLALALCMLLSLAPAALAEETLPPEDNPAEAAAEAPTEALEPEVPQEEPAEEPAEVAKPGVPQEEPADEPVGDGVLDVPQEEPAEAVEPEVPQDNPAEEPVEDDSPDTPQEEPAEADPAEEPDDADEEESVSTEAAEITVAPGGERPENGWYNDGEHTYYYEIGGPGGSARLRNEIREIDGSWYYFDENGWMLDDAEKKLDWDDDSHQFLYIRARAGGELYVNEWYKKITSSGSMNWYYYGKEGYRVKGLQQIDGSTYCFENNYIDPYLYTDGTYKIDGYSYAIDESGRATKLNYNGWTQANGFWYYCIDGEYLHDHVREIDSDWYGFDWRGKLRINQFFACREAGSNTEEYFYAGSNGKLAANKWALFDYAWHYFGSNRRMCKSGTYTIDGKRYTFDEWGNCTNRKVGTGWVKSDGQWHYFDQHGWPAHGWTKIDGKWYYFAGSGINIMLTGKQRIDGKTYYFSDSGVMLANKWMQEDGKWLYLNSSGALATGWQKIGGTWYYFESDGAMVTGRKTIDGKSYVFADSGAMAANKWLEESDGWHYRDGNGHEVTGWYKVSSKWYYFDGNGVMLTGKQEIGDKLYFFADSGAMQAGKWVQDGADWYYLGSGGDAYRSQWLKSGGKWYYFDENCVMLADTSREIKGKTYHFNASGVCINP